MTTHGILNPLFNTNALLTSSVSGQSSRSGSSAQTSEFDSLFNSLLLRSANLQSQMLGTLLGSASSDGTADQAGGIDSLLATLSAGTSAIAGSSEVDGLSATGRNLALFDPESAYDMMSFLNSNDVNCKAQYSELSDMKTALLEMQQLGKNLGQIGLDTGNDSIKSQLQNFVKEYNAWEQRFAADMQQGGLLSSTQAAQVARHELEESVENRFNGAADGLHGLADLGISIDPVSKQAVFDSAKLDAVLSSNQEGAVHALQQFSGNFAKSAELLVSEGNFILNRLDNLDRVIDYYADHKTALQAEFGSGDAAKPTGQIAQALEAYNRVYSI